MSFRNNAFINNKSVNNKVVVNKFINNASTTASTTQYDSIGQSYDRLKRLPAARLERNNVRDVVKPMFADNNSAQVLDLACGTGYYSRLLLSWGADSVTGVDISSAMIEAAKDAANGDAANGGVGGGSLGESKSGLTFTIGDCTRPLQHLGLPPVDVVVGAWLLNYAATAEEVTAMFDNIARSLRAGGYFVGVTPHPAEDLDAFASKFAGRPNKYGVDVAYTARNELGYKTHITFQTSTGQNPIAFDNSTYVATCTNSVPDKGA